MVIDLKRQPAVARDIPSWQGIHLFLVIAIFAMATLVCRPALAQLHDALDAHPPRWHLDASDCQAQVTAHKHLADGGLDGRGCETVIFSATHGSEAIFVYRTEPVEVRDELTANLSVMSARSGCRIGFRVRFPYQQDEKTGQAIAVIVYGADYDDPGRFASIGVGMIERPLRLKKIAVRREFGADADLRDPYVDAVVLNAFSGPGTTALRLDELSVSGMIPVGDSGRVPSRLEKENRSTVMRIGENGAERLIRTAPRTSDQAFPVGKVTRILQHNGEPLAWVRSLGFDGVLLSQPPKSSILREAIRNRMLIYAPPPTAPDPNLQPLLEPVAAWYIGSEVAFDRRHIKKASEISQRIRAFPQRWQRPILAAPAEAWSQYAPLVDAMVDDLPLRARGLSGKEEAAEIFRARQSVGNRVEAAVGIATLPPEAALKQSEAIARAIGAPGPQSTNWHSMWAQAIRCLESTPKAIVFRSSRPLSSGSDLDSQRAMSLSYINRMIAMLEPWLVQASPAVPPQISGGAYRCARLNLGGTDFLLITSTAIRGDEILSGDGDTIEIALSPDDASKMAWRLTHFSAERVTAELTNLGTRLQIVSPDVVEIIALSSDPKLGGELSQSAKRFSRQASLDRWQLTSDLVRRTSEEWNLAIAARASNRPIPQDLLNVASKTLADAEPLFRAGDIDASLRMARRADAWALRCKWQLSEALMPDWPHPTSCPPVLCNATAAQVAWHPLMDDTGWSTNYLTTGSLDQRDVLSDGRWTIGKRLEKRAASEVTFVSRGVFNGAGALRTTVTPLTGNVLPGGYEGTAVQISSPSIRIPAGRAFRIDAMVRTIGFGGPHQGVLIYDSTAGQESGVLVRGRSDWTPVRLYRQTLKESTVRVMFEVIGGGEATIDEVALQLWEPKTPDPLPLRPMSQISQQPVVPSTSR